MKMGVASFMPMSLYSWEKTSFTICTRERVGPRTIMDVAQDTKITDPSAN
jgi:hypothetical protein